jgi:hypothetical protein
MKLGCHAKQTGNTVKNKTATGDQGTGRHHLGSEALTHSAKLDVPLQSYHTRYHCSRLTTLAPCL